MKIDLSNKNDLLVFLTDFASVQHAAESYFNSGLDYIDELKFDSEPDSSELDTTHFELYKLYRDFYLKWCDQRIFLGVFERQFQNAAKFIVDRMDEGIALEQFRDDFIRYSAHDFNTLCFINYWDVSEVWFALMEIGELPYFGDKPAVETTEVLKPKPRPKPEITEEDKRAFSFTKAKNKSPVLFQSATSAFTELVINTNSAASNICTTI